MLKRPSTDLSSPPSPQWPCQGAPKQDIKQSLLSSNDNYSRYAKFPLVYIRSNSISDLFHTDEQDSTKLKNSSYLDLGPLYGHNQDQQDQVRTFADGRLKPDTFSEKRLLTQPPGVCALLVAFNRFHNWIVGELAFINEAGRFSLPTGMTQDYPKYVEAVSKRDNDLFQIGRLYVRIRYYYVRSC